MENIAHLLTDLARRQSNTPAVVFTAGHNTDGGLEHPIYSHLTFGELARRSDALAWGLHEYGVKPGMTALLMIRPALDFYALTFALLKVGAVPVLIDPGMGVKGFLRCVRQVKPQLFLGIPKAHILRVLFPGSFRSVKYKITMGNRRLWGGKCIPELLRHSHGEAPYPVYTPSKPGELAAVLFTSGSTGPAKGVCYTHEIFTQQCKIVQRLCNIQPGECDLACFPLFSLFSIANGATAVVPEMDATRPASVNPERILEALSSWPVSYSFGSPALWKHVGEYCTRQGKKLPGLKRIFMSGAPVPATTHKMLAALMEPGAATYAPYGCTESLPIAVLDGATVANETTRQTEQGRGVCVGTPIPEVTVKIIAITDAPIPKWDESMVLTANKIGEICVKGGCVTRNYFARPDADEFSKILEADGSFWHRVGDTGYLDEEGRLWFCGRKNHRVESANGPFYSICAEAFFNRQPGVARSALVGVKDGSFQRPIIILEALPGEKPDLSAIIQAAEKEGIAPELREMLIYPGSFPVDVRHNAKINRESLAIWAQKQLS